MALVRHMLRQAVRCTARSTPTSMRGPATLVGGASRGSLRAVAPTFCRGLASVVHLPDAAAQYPRPQVQVASKAPMFTAPALVQGEIETVCAGGGCGAAVVLCLFAWLLAASPNTVPDQL